MSIERIEFRPSRPSTLGVEWELALVDNATGELVSLADDLLAAVRPDGKDEHPRIKQELLLNTVEVITDVCNTVGESVDDIRASMAELRAVTEPRNVGLMSAGTHPFSVWYRQEVSDRARYHELIERTQWWGRQMLIYGVHVHVGIDARSKVLPVVNSLLRYYPHLQALSASSPFWGGEDTSYASNRALMFQQLPTAGLPFQFSSWSDYERYVDDMMRTGVIQALNEVRWDIRPAPALGTVEVRVCDGVPTMLELGAVAALTQCLVDDMSRRLDAGATLPKLPPWFCEENKWRSARYGLDAVIIVDADGTERPVADEVAGLVDYLMPTAGRLGCEKELDDVRTILRVGASYQRQRAVADAAGGDLPAVVRALEAEMRAEVPSSVLTAPEGR